MPRSQYYCYQHFGQQRRLQCNDILKYCCYKQHSRFPVHGAFKFDVNTLLGTTKPHSIAIAMLMSHCCHHSLSDALHNDAQFVGVDYFAINLCTIIKSCFSALGKLLLLLPNLVSVMLGCLFAATHKFLSELSAKH